MLIEALDDPAFARTVANRLALPAFPIQGGACTIDPATILAGNFSCSGNFNFTGGNVGIGSASPLGALDVSAISWVYLRNNVGLGGQSNPSASAQSGLSLGWNASNGNGESQILYSTALGSVPRLDFGRWDGTTKTIDMTLKDGKLGIGTTSPTVKLNAVDNTNGVVGAMASSSALGANLVLTQTGAANPSKYLRSYNGSFQILNSAYSAALVTVQDDGNVGIGTTSPVRPLHVKGGDIVVEGGGFGLVDSGMSDPSTVLYEGGSDITILRTYDVGQSPAPAATLLNISAPPESGTFPTANREATLTLQRATNDETYAEYLDLYNNYYPGGSSPSTQYGIRIQKRNPPGETNAQYRDFVFDQWDGSASAPTTLMALKVNGNIGIGTLNPQTLLDVAGQTRVKPANFSALPPASSSIEGAIAAVTDSTTNTWGATIAGGGTNHVLAYCDGTNWTVAGK